MGAQPYHVRLINVYSIVNNLGFFFKTPRIEYAKLNCSSILHSMSWWNSQGEERKGVLRGKASERCQIKLSHTHNLFYTFLLVVFPAIFSPFLSLGGLVYISLR